MKATIKLGLDLGASRIKFSFMKGKEVLDDCFNNMVDGSATASGIKVTVDEETLTVGTVSGYSNSVVKKINYKNVLHILFAVAYRVKDILDLAEDDIVLKINTVLPPQEFKESRNQYKELIKSADGKEAIVNGSKIKLKITDVKVGAESVALAAACNMDKIAKDLTKVIIMDVGASTTDLAMVFKSDGVWRIKDAHTIYTAGKHLCNSVATTLNSNGSGLSYKGEELEIMQAYELDGKRHTLEEVCDGKATNMVVDSMTSEINNWLGNIRQYKVILGGGGSRVLKFNKKFNEYTKFECLEDSLLDYGNSRGALKS